MSENPYPVNTPLWSARNTIDKLVQRSQEDEQRIRALGAEVARLTVALAKAREKIAVAEQFFVYGGRGR